MTRPRVSRQPQRICSRSGIPGNQRFRSLPQDASHCSEREGHLFRVSVCAAIAVELSRNFGNPREGFTGVSTKRGFIQARHVSPLRPEEPVQVFHGRAFFPLCEAGPLARYGP